MQSLEPAVPAEMLPVGMIPREALFGNPERSDPQLSPDGTRLAYLAPKDGVLNVWVRTVGQQDDRVVTSDRERGVRFFGWQLDSEHIFYIQDKDGDENWHLYQTRLGVATPDEVATRDLTPYEGVQAQIVAGDPRFPDMILVALNMRDPKLHDVYRLDLKTGAIELDTENPGDVAGWSADHALRVRVAQSFEPDGSTVLRTREDADTPWRELLRWGPEETFGGVAGFTPDDRAVWLISSVGANAARLVELDLASGAQKIVVDDPQYDVGGIMTHPRTHALEAVHVTRARGDWTVLDAMVRADFDVLRKFRDGDFGVVSRDLADTVWLVAYVEDDAPASWYVYQRASRNASFLFTDRPVLEGYRLAAMRPVSFTARDGMTLHGYVTFPEGKPAINLPTVLLVHGGPWARDVWGFDSYAQWLANRGYAVLQVNFRGSTGYGKAYLNAGDHEWGGKMHADLLDGKRWAVEQGFADPAKVCIMGGSYGGYAALVGLAFTPDEFVCGVDIVGPSNLVTLLQSIPPYWETARAVFHRRMGADEGFLKSRSPLFRADRIQVPLLIAQGANDPRVKQAESDQIVAAMRKNGQPVEYLVFPDEGHGFARPENLLKFAAATEPFLARYLGGTVEPPSEEERWEELEK